MDSSERDNIIHWDGNRRGWYEVWFCKLVDPAQECAFWFRYTLLVPKDAQKEAVSELWGMFYDGHDPHSNTAIKETFPLAYLQAARDHFSLHLDGALLTHGRACGRLQKGAQRIEWDLNFIPNQVSYYHLFPLLRRLEITKSRICSPNLDTRWRGRLTVNGREIILTDAPGQQSHIWGVKHAESWAWAHCNAFSGSPDTVLEAFSAIIKLGPVTLPPLTPFYFRYQGRAYSLNGPRHLFKNHTRFTLGSWDFDVEAADMRFSGQVRGHLQNIIGVRYIDPDGEPRFCYHDELSDCTVQVFRRVTGSWEQVDELKSAGTCAGEWVSRQQVPELPLQV